MCYSMCNYVESDKGPWHRTHLYSQAKTAAEIFTGAGTMIKQAKTLNLRYFDPNQGFYETQAAAAGQNNRWTCGASPPPRR